MRYIDILVSLEREINKFDDPVQKPSTDESLFWLNQAVAKFVKTRFNGDIVHGTSYEQNEKRRNDLIKLYQTIVYQSDNMQVDESEPSYTSYYAQYPNDFMFALNEDVVISDLQNHNKINTCMFLCCSFEWLIQFLDIFRNRSSECLRGRPAHGGKTCLDSQVICCGIPGLG